MGLNSSVTETFKAVAARIVGPPQGTRFIVPAESATMQAKVIRFIPN